MGYEHYVGAKAKFVPSIVSEDQVDPTPQPSTLTLNLNPRPLALDPNPLNPDSLNPDRLTLTP